MSGAAWVDVEPDDLSPVVLVVGGLLAIPGDYRGMATALRGLGAADVLVAPIYRPDWLLAAVRGLGPIVARTGRALLAAGELSARSQGSLGAPIMLVGHSAGGIVGRIMTSPVEFEGRRTNAGGRIAALVTLGTPHGVGDEARWGRRIGTAGVRFCNRHIPGAFLAPTTAYVAIASDFIVGDAGDDGGRARHLHWLYEDILPSGGDRAVAGDGLVPAAAALLPGARHVTLHDAVHGPSLHSAWYGAPAQVGAWWPVALLAWRDAIRARRTPAAQQSVGNVLAAADDPVGPAVGAAAASAMASPPVRDPLAPASAEAGPLTDAGRRRKVANT